VSTWSGTFPGSRWGVASAVLACALTRPRSRQGTGRKPGGFAIDRSLGDGVGGLAHHDSVGPRIHRVCGHRDRALVAVPRPGQGDARAHAQRGGCLGAPRRRDGAFAVRAVEDAGGQDLPGRAALEEHRARRPGPGACHVAPGGGAWSAPRAVDPGHDRISGALRGSAGNRDRNPRLVPGHGQRGRRRLCRRGGGHLCRSGRHGRGSGRGHLRAPGFQLPVDARHQHRQRPGAFLRALRPGAALRGVRSQCWPGRAARGRAVYGGARWLRRSTSLR
jgi:hypothetical protein